MYNFTITLSGSVPAATKEEAEAMVFGIVAEAMENFELNCSIEVTEEGKQNV